MFAQIPVPCQNATLRSKSRTNQFVSYGTREEEWANPRQGYKSAPAFCL